MITAKLSLDPRSLLFSNWARHHFETGYYPKQLKEKHNNDFNPDPKHIFLLKKNSIFDIIAL